MAISGARHGLSPSFLASRGWGRKGLADSPQKLTRASHQGAYRLTQLCHRPNVQPWFWARCGFRSRTGRMIG